MANNPLYDDSLKHWLNFKSPNFGRVQIAEPINFDSFSFKISQAKDRFGRDKEIGGEEIDLEFSDVYTEKLDYPQTLIDGTIIYELSHRLDLIFEALKEKGSESEIEYILTRNGVEVVLGLFDVPESTTDGYSSFKCSIIQNTNKALIERKKDIKADVFSETDTFGNYQKPLDKAKVFLKAKPTTEISEWGNKEVTSVIQAGVATNCQISIPISNNLLKYGLKNSFSPFDVVFKGFDVTSTENNRYRYANAFFTAQESLTNIKIYIKGLSFVGATNFGTYQLNIARAVFDEDGDWVSNVGETIQPILSEGSVNVLNQDYIIDVPPMNSGETLNISATCFFATSSIVSFDMNIDLFTIDSLRITATSTAVSSVIDAVPYFDFLEQGVKSISGLKLDAYDIEGGEFSGQYVFNGSMIRQRNDVPLNFVFKDEMNDIKEVNMDYQIQDDKVVLYQYPDFYTLNDLGAFLQVPNLEFERKFNDRFKKVSLNYSYKTYEQDKDQFNTIDAFQTEAQFLFPTKQVDDELKVDINHIRDAFTIETARREAISETTALSTDDKIFIVDCVEIPEGYTESITRTLRMRLNDGLLLEILSDNVNWTLLGFKNGDTVYITSGENIGEYAILQHGVSLLELVFIGSGAEPEFSGISLITLEYPLTNVTLMNRTNEGFNLIENIENPNDVSNLKYSIKRNLSRYAWSSYLATICKDNLDGVIKCTDFKVNGNLTTRFEFGQILKENEDIHVSDLSYKILNKYVYKTTLMVSFEDAKKLIEDIVLLRGFIRIYDTQNRVIKVHPQTIDMNWALGEMEIVGEARNENDFVVITSSEQGISIFDVGYDTIINRDLDWFKIDGNYVQIFDNEQKPLINPTNFQKISVNGEFFQDRELFYIKLDNL